MHQLRGKLACAKSELRVETYIFNKNEFLN